LNEFGEWSDEVTSNITILNNQPIPIIDLITPSPVEKGINISFHGSGQDIDGNITGYYWSSTIDGELSAEQDFNTSTLSLGHHTISFRIKDNDGLWSYIVSEELFVYTSPVAKAGDNITIEPYQIVQFVGIATDEDGSIVKYEWDFDGDGVFDWSLGENGRTTNVYNEEGEYTAVLRATDNDGFTSTAFRVINVTKGGTNGGGGDDDDSPAPSFIVATMIVVIVAIRRQVRT